MSTTADLPLFTPPPERPAKARFDGPTYSPGEDDARLTEQIRRVFDALNGRGWKTVSEIAAETRDPEPSVSAQLRHLRKARFGLWNVEKRRRPGFVHLWEYRIDGHLEAAVSEFSLRATLAELREELASLRATVSRLEKREGAK
jgi:hypothetical protein